MTVPGPKLLSSEQAKAAFFYGTLMHPKILLRVIGNDGAHLEICSAVLMDFTRHQVKGADYPGIIPFSKSCGALFQGRDDLTQEEKCVKGTLVTGLTKADVKFLDMFEGTEYTRDEVKVYPLGPFVTLSSHSEELEKMFNPAPLPGELPSTVDCETYVHKYAERLEASTWDFADFVKHNAWKWYGADDDDSSDSEGEEVITEVDRRWARSVLLE